MLSIRNSEVNSNSARFGGGIFNAGAGAVATLDATEVANNTTMNAAGGGVVVRARVALAQCRPPRRFSPGVEGQRVDGGVHRIG